MDWEKLDHKKSNKLIIKNQLKLGQNLQKDTNNNRGWKNKTHDKEYIFHGMCVNVFVDMVSFAPCCGTMLPPVPHFESFDEKKQTIKIKKQ